MGNIALIMSCLTWPFLWLAKPTTSRVLALGWPLARLTSNSGWLFWRHCPVFLFPSSHLFVWDNNSFLSLGKNFKGIFNRVTLFVLYNSLCLARQEMICSHQPLSTNQTDSKTWGTKHISRLESSFLKEAFTWVHFGLWPGIILPRLDLNGRSPKD